MTLDALAREYRTMLSIIADGDAGLAAVRKVVAAADQVLPLASTGLLAPIERPGKYLAIGMNYRKHVEEAKRLGVGETLNQYWFNKQTNCIFGPFDDTDPGVSIALDYEVELCVVIGISAKGVARDNARDHIFGYMVCNDVSARDWQRQSPTFTVGKSFDTHGPTGPCIVTAISGSPIQPAIEEDSEAGAVLRSQVGAVVQATEGRKFYTLGTVVGLEYESH